jgi:hypothetical protein
MIQIDVSPTLVQRPGGALALVVVVIQGAAVAIKLETSAELRAQLEAAELKAAAALAAHQANPALYQAAPAGAA